MFWFFPIWFFQLNSKKCAECSFCWPWRLWLRPSPLPISSRRSGWPLRWVIYEISRIITRKYRNSKPQMAPEWQWWMKANDSMLLFMFNWIVDILHFHCFGLREHSFGLPLMIHECNGYCCCWCCCKHSWLDHPVTCRLTWLAMLWVQSREECHMSGGREMLIDRTRSATSFVAATRGVWYGSAQLISPYSVCAADKQRGPIQATNILKTSTNSKPNCSVTH